MGESANGRKRLLSFRFRFAREFDYREKSRYSGVCLACAFNCRNVTESDGF